MSWLSSQIVVQPIHNDFSLGYLMESIEGSVISYPHATHVSVDGADTRRSDETQKR